MTSTINQSSSVKGALSAPFAIVIATALYALAFTTQAAPSLNQVTNGNATITQNTNNTTINQTTNNATIDWHSFNVAQNKTVTFNQPDTQSLTINNITDSNPSQILGLYHRKRQNSSA